MTGVTQRSHCSSCKYDLFRLRRHYENHCKSKACYVQHSSYLLIAVQLSSSQFFHKEVPELTSLHSWLKLCFLYSRLFSAFPQEAPHANPEEPFHTTSVKNTVWGVQRHKVSIFPTLLLISIKPTSPTRTVTSEGPWKQCQKQSGKVLLEMAVLEESQKKNTKGTKSRWAEKYAARKTCQ